MSVQESQLLLSMMKKSQGGHLQKHNKKLSCFSRRHDELWAPLRPPSTVLAEHDNISCAVQYQPEGMSQALRPLSDNLVCHQTSIILGVLTLSQGVFTLPPLVMINGPQLHGWGMSSHCWFLRSIMYWTHSTLKHTSFRLTWSHTRPLVWTIVPSPFSQDGAIAKLGDQGRREVTFVD